MRIIAEHDFNFEGISRPEPRRALLDCTMDLGHAPESEQETLYPVLGPLDEAPAPLQIE